MAHNDLVNNARAFFQSVNDASTINGLFGQLSISWSEGEEMDLLERLKAAALGFWQEKLESSPEKQAQFSLKYFGMKVTPDALLPNILSFVGAFHDLNVNAKLVSKRFNSVYFGCSVKIFCLRA